MTLALILAAVLCLAYANGANDNFKGVATLFGTGTTHYRGALAWATVATLLGSLTAVLLAGQLLKNFTGKGLVDAQLAGTPSFAAAVAIGAGLTVLLATRIGMPVSTTHGLIGALVGAGWAADSSIDVPKLATTFFAPLLVSPFVAIALTSVIYLQFRSLRRRLGVTRETCVCVGNEVLEVVPACEDATLAMQRVASSTIAVAEEVTCRQRYGGRVLGLQASSALDALHYVSAGVVCFARGLNDTPKIAALLLVAPQFDGFTALTLIGALIAVGGLVSARRVAETMSNEITPMNHGQGFTANLITGLVVLGASRFGVPVSTTHVSCGSLFGIGVVSGGADRATIGRILASWITTLPLAAAVAAIVTSMINW